DNSAGGDGGAIVQIGNLEVEFESDYFDFVCQGNTAGGNGGAMATENAPAQMEGATFLGNSATTGGAIYQIGNLEVEFESDYFDAVFEDNSATENGGGMYVEAAILGAMNCLFFDNSATAGAGLFVGSDSHAAIGNTTVAGNTSDGVGGIGGNASDVAIVDSIFWENGTDLSPQFSVSYCFFATPTAGEGNLSGNPMLVTGAQGDYYLDPESPCINAGSQSAEAAGLSSRTTQTDGTPDTGQVDMGYHYLIPEE
ncbi:MAG: hypothetical protein JW759_09000, partial [Candidatus Coatesbacteria bacterium]|nr:hypothetical protein [Candidatus Coatesbacteria bacterium]